MSKNFKITHNADRIKHLMMLFGLSEHQFLEKISEGNSTPYTKENVFGSEISINALKRIDKIFNKGLDYYLDLNPPIASKEASIFFRKEFGTELNLADRKLINKYEEIKNSLGALASLSNFHIKRVLKEYSIQDSPISVANEVREQFQFKKKNSSAREFLKSLIYDLANLNVYVFEEIIYPSTKAENRPNIDGFFIKPNVIGIKNNYYPREIFTLIHEFAHYLIGEEEIESVDEDLTQYTSKVNKIERWCNDFAFAFLIGEHSNILEKIEKVDSTNDYCDYDIQEISEKTYLSKIAIYTHLLYVHKMTKADYTMVKKGIDDKNKEEKLRKEEQKKKDKESGNDIKFFYPSKPILSPLHVATIQSAFYEGVINDYEVCKKLDINPSQLEKYIG